MLNQVIEVDCRTPLPALTYIHVKKKSEWIGVLACSRLRHCVSFLENDPNIPCSTLTCGRLADKWAQISCLFLSKESSHPFFHPWCLLLPSLTLSVLHAGGCVLWHAFFSLMLPHLGVSPFQISRSDRGRTDVSSSSRPPFPRASPHLLPLSASPGPWIPMRSAVINFK